MLRLNSFRNSGIYKNCKRRNSNYYNFSRNSENYKDGPNPTKKNINHYNKSTNTTYKDNNIVSNEI